MNGEMNTALAPEEGPADTAVRDAATWLGRGHAHGPAVAPAGGHAGSPPAAVTCGRDPRPQSQGLLFTNEALNTPEPRASRGGRQPGVGGQRRGKGLSEELGTLQPPSPGLGPGERSQMERPSVGSVLSASLSCAF